MEKNVFTMAVVEPDDDDRTIFKAALDAIGCRAECTFMENADEMLDCLTRKGNYADAGGLPDIIVLDLNIGGGDLLKEIKSESSVKHIPVVVLAPTGEDEDIEQQCSGLEQDAVVVKPMGFDNYVEALRTALEPYCRKATR